MSVTLSDLMRLAYETVRAPREGAQRVMGAPMSRNDRWLALTLTVIVSVILGKLNQFAAPVEGNPLMQSFLGNPLAMALIQFSLLVITVYAVYWIGRATGGQGSFEDSILLIAWMQFIMICLQVMQTVALFLVPPLADLIGLMGLVLFFWLLTNFVAELHGFDSLGKVFLMILVSIVGIAFGLSLILSLIGIAVPGA
jgi:hypothetical protein